MPNTPQFQTARRGVTLVELLVVISIMLLLMAVAIPMLRPMLDRRPVREAARSVSDYFAAAQIRARETGRPAGVWIERFSNHAQAAFTLYQAEVPLPYGGDSTSSTVALSFVSAAGGWATFDANFASGFNPSLLQPGDTLQVNYQGPWYSFSTISNPAQVRLNISDGTTVPWMTTPSVALPYKIYRQPKRTAARPMQLPGSTVIDLYASGTGTLTQFAPASLTDAHDLIVVFAPNGAVDSLLSFDRTSGSYSSIAMTGDPIHFLIGRRDRLATNPPGDMTSLAEDGLLNWQDLNNLWVTVFPRNGLVTVSENAQGANAVDARRYAGEGQSLGGR